MVTNKYASRVLEYNNTNSQKINARHINSSNFINIYIYIYIYIHAYMLTRSCVLHILTDDFLLFDSCIQQFKQCTL